MKHGPRPRRAWRPQGQWLRRLPGFLRAAWPDTAPARRRRSVEAAILRSVVAVKRPADHRESQGLGRSRRRRMGELGAGRDSGGGPQFMRFGNGALQAAPVEAPDGAAGAHHTEAVSARPSPSPSVLGGGQNYFAGAVTSPRDAAAAVRRANAPAATFSTIATRLRLGTPAAGRGRPRPPARVARLRERRVPRRDGRGRSPAPRIGVVAVCVRRRRPDRGVASARGRPVGGRPRRSDRPRPSRTPQGGAGDRPRQTRGGRAASSLGPARIRSGTVRPVSSKVRIPGMQPGRGVVRRDRRDLPSAPSPPSSAIMEPTTPRAVASPCSGGAGIMETPSQ